MLSLTKRQIWFFSSAVFSRVWIILSFLIIDWFFDVKVSAEWSVNVAVISLMSFLFMFGGGVAVFRESTLNPLEGKKRLFSHTIIGFALSVIVMTFYPRFEVVTLALIASQLDLLEARYKGLDRPVVMAFSQMLKVVLILFAIVSILSMEIFVVLIMTFEVLVLLWIIRESSTVIELPMRYSYHNIIIGSLAWIVNSSDKVIASWYLNDNDLRVYSLTYFTGYFILFGSSLFTNLSSQKFVHGGKRNIIFLFTSFLRTYPIWAFLSLSVLILGSSYYGMDSSGGLLILLSSTLIGFYSIGQLEHIRNGNLAPIVKINMIAGVINLVVNIVFLPIYGVVTLYFSSVLASVIMLVSLILLYRKNENIS
jgi:hypothetical protein